MWHQLLKILKDLRMKIIDKNKNIVLETFTVDLIGYNFFAVDLTNAVMDSLVLEAACFFDVTFTNVTFKKSDLYMANFSFENLDGVNFEGACLRGASFEGASLKSANLKNTDLSFDLFGCAAELLGADLSNALLEGAVLKGVEYDSKTIFPDLFDPLKQGMVNVSTTPKKKKSPKRNR